MIATETCLLPVFDRFPLELQSGEGCYVFDSSGKRYLDAITGIGVNALGHNHPRILAALIDQAQRSIHTSNLYEHPYQLPLAERLCEMSGMDRVFFSSTGTEAVEAALKAVRAYWNTRGGRRSKLVALRDSFHGRTLGSLAVTYRPKYRTAFAPLAPEVTFVDPNDCDGLSGAIQEDTAAVILEPVLGEGGIVPLEDEFLRLARERASDAGALLIADEVQCGLGRTGCYFGYQWPGIRPDIVVAAKPLAGGLPLGATLFTEAAAEAMTTGLHGTTVGGGPLACRVALEFLSVMDELLPNIQDVGKYLKNALRRLDHSAIIEIRGRGLMIGIELSRPARPVVERAMRMGLLLNYTNETVLRLLPPYILSRAEADEIVRVIGEALYAQE